MKIHEIKTAYGFNQRTFYQWLRDKELITKGDKGYITGEQALPSMETIESVHYRNGVTKTYSLVKVGEDDVPEIVERYFNSGYNNLFSRDKNRSAEIKILKQLLEEITDRLDILEEHVGLEQ